MIKYGKIINNETKECEVGLGTDVEYYKSLGMVLLDVEQSWYGAWFLKGFTPIKPAPSIDELKELRAIAYAEEVDPITAHIQRLRDDVQTEETMKKINELIAERNKVVADIKERYPY